MNQPPSRHLALLKAAVERLHHAGRDAVRRTVDQLGVAALAAPNMRDRDLLLGAQFELNRNLASFDLAFGERLQEQLARGTDTSGHTRPLATAQWESLSLVDDREVEAQVSADRFALQVEHASEWDLRELDAYVAGVLRLGRPERERNLLRPEVVGKAMLGAIDAVSERPEVRKLLGQEIGKHLAAALGPAYGEVVEQMRHAGVRPVGMTLRQVDGPGNDLGVNTSGYGALERPADPTADEPAPGDGGWDGGGAGEGWGGGAPGHGPAGGPMTGRGGHAPSYGPGFGGASTTGYGHPSTTGQGTGRDAMRPGGRRTGSPGGGAFGHVDPPMMSLIRRLAHVGSAGDSGAGLLEDAAHAAYAPTAVAGGPGAPIAPNLIYAHRDELRQASTGMLDHMVIDVVGSLFEQILADPKVPPQMARQIARLQLPVLRVALGDVTFFSSRRHPVRRFVNRIASLAVAYEDLTENPGLEFLGLVRDLVQEIVHGDFDQMEVYEQKLAALEAFTTAEARREAKEKAGDATSLLEGKESDLLLHQRYMQQLRAALAPVAMPEFLRDFLAQVWSQVMVQVARRQGADSDAAKRMRRAGRDLVMSVQPKGTPADRKAFLMALPHLMKDLNDGMAMVGWPQPAQKAFFARLLPAHAESLKGQSISQLDFNMLARQLDTILAAPLPKPGEAAPPAGPIPVLSDVVVEQTFSADEARRVGLVQEHQVDWDGRLDIDLTAEPEVAAQDITIDGLPAAEPVEPTRGPTLAEHVQIGFAYQMHLEGQWQKVKLTYVSPGRAFFVFSRGRKHQQTISMTSRMLTRMCESGRLRAFENAYLLERATARARKQLASLSAAHAPAWRAPGPAPR